MLAHVLHCAPNGASGVVTAFWQACCKLVLGTTSRALCRQPKRLLPLSLDMFTQPFMQEVNKIVLLPLIDIKVVTAFVSDHF